MKDKQLTSISNSNSTNFTIFGTCHYFVKKAINNNDNYAHTKQTEKIKVEKFLSAPRFAL